MEVKNVSIPIDIIIELLKRLSEEAKQEVFEKVFFEEDITPLTIEEKNELEKAEKELKNGETISWPFGKYNFQKMHISTIKHYKRDIKER